MLDSKKWKCSWNWLCWHSIFFFIVFISLMFYTYLTFALIWFMFLRLPKTLNEILSLTLTNASYKGLIPWRRLGQLNFMMAYMSSHFLHSNTVTLNFHTFIIFLLINVIRGTKDWATLHMKLSCILIKCFIFLICLNPLPLVIHV